MAARRTLYRIGILILVIGFLGAGLSFWAAQRQEALAHAKIQAETGDSSDLTLSPDDSKVSNYNSEVTMGKPAMLIEQFFHWIGQLFQGKSLPYTIATISIVAAFSCFALADRASPR